MRVPGPKGKNLKTAQADGARVEVVYSPVDALAVAKANPGRTVVFLGVGFETTAPAVAATIRLAREQNLKNFKVLSFHKLVPPALDVLLADPEASIDAFILPGHDTVSPEAACAARASAASMMSSNASQDVQ